MILVAVVVALAALAVWKLIDYRSEPPVPTFVSTPERVDALRYLNEAKNSANAAGNDGSIMGDIAAWQTTAGDLAAARVTAKAIKEEGERSFAWIKISAAQMEMGDLGGARATVKVLGSGAEEFIEEAWAVVAAAQAKAGNIAGARATTSAITQDPFKIIALAEIAAAQAKAGDRAGANQTFAEAESLANALEDAFGKNSALLDLTFALAKSGDVPKARITAGRITGIDRATSLQAIATAQARAGDVAGAKATANEISGNGADAITNSYYKVLALRDVALAQARAGDQPGASQTFDDAKAAIDPRTSDVSRMGALREIAVAQAKAGDVPGAKATLKAVTDNDSKASSVLGAIAAAQAKAGGLAEAKATLATIVADRLNNNLLGSFAAVIRAQAGLEGFPATELWVQALGEPKARTLYYIALAKARLNPSAPESDESEDEDKPGQIPH